MAAPAKGGKFTLYSGERQDLTAERAVAALTKGKTHLS